MFAAFSPRKGINRHFSRNRLWSAVFAVLIFTNIAAPAPAEGPLFGRIICVDAGHGGYDGGARARDSGVWEKEINLAVALQVQSELEAMGAQVIMTRQQDEDLSHFSNGADTKKRRDLKARLTAAEAAGAQLLLSIHMNEYHQRTSCGPQVFYTQGHESSRLLAGCLQQSLITILRPPRERAALPGDYYILKLPIPSCLVECGFISNPEEEKKLLTPAYQKLLAQAIARGVWDFFELQSRQNMLK